MSKSGPTPSGMTPAAFGEKVMKWGSGDADAIQRIETISVEELISSGVTLEIASEWHQFYADVIAENPRNPSARGRMQLIAHVMNLLEQRS